jgi:transposase InsO family protein
MLFQEELLNWFQTLALSESAQAIIQHVRTDGPARRVGGGRLNVSGRYPSRKMGVTVQFESHRVELSAIYELEHDDDVLEYYDQPPPIKLDYQSAKGRHLGVLHTADYFVLRCESVGWEECKTEDGLTRLSEQNVNRYCPGVDGWRCPPGEAYANRFGFYYRVRSSREIDWIFQRNIQFLDDYYRGDSIVPSSTSVAAVTAAVDATPGILLEELLSVVDSLVSSDDVYWLIASGKLYVDLHAAVLAEASRVNVFPSLQAAMGHSARMTRQYSTSEAEQHRAKETNINHGAECSAETWKQIVKASDVDLQAANHRFEHVTRALRGEAPHKEAEVPARTLRRWVGQYREAERTLGSGYLGLLPRIAQRGNRTARLTESTKAVITEVIENDYETLKQKTIFASWLALKLSCEGKSIVVPSYKTFRLAVHQRPRFAQTLKRQGHRAAYEHEAFYWQLDQGTPSHGDRPFEIGHIDHTQLDVEAVCSMTGRGLGRPWMTLLIDALSRRILAFYLTFDPPSYRSCMMVLRECVRRHARLPQIEVVDGGREFESIYFETLLARYECTKKTRPPAKARFGSVCERIFCTTNTQFIYNLRGNTQITRQVRQVTQSVNPKGLAMWPLKELQERLGEYFYEIYDVVDHPALGRSPRDAFEDGVSRTGYRAHRRVSYDQEFLVQTLPTTRKGTAKVSPGRGIKVHYLYYWCEEFRDPSVEKSHVAIRYDPFDVGTVHTFVHNQWVECHSEYHSDFRGHSEREIMLATEEIRKRRRNHAERFPVSARKLAQFLHSVETDEKVLAQRLCDIESRRARSEIATGPASIPIASEGAEAMNVCRPIEVYGEL